MSDRLSVINNLPGDGSCVVPSNGHHSCSGSLAGGFLQFNDDGIFLSTPARRLTYLERIKREQAVFNAYAVVARARRSGDLRSMPCEVCGKRGHAHHSNYLKPLLIKWLCNEHHQRLHAKEKKAIGKGACINRRGLIKCSRCNHRFSLITARRQKYLCCVCFRHKYGKRISHVLAESKFKNATKVGNGE